MVDDDPATRQGFSYSVRRAKREPVDVGPSLGTLRNYLDKPFLADAAIIDQNLRPSGYASFEGAELVAEWYQRGIPAVLCTRFDKSQANFMVPYRRWMPVVMSPDDLDPASLLTGIEGSLKEIEGSFSVERKPWRSQVHFVSFDHESRMAFVEIPAWGSGTIGFRHSNLPKWMPRGKNITGERYHAQVNLGAEHLEDLYVYDWERP
ncbi:hypothetical protein [uncultured Amnibacterium sp.]|uniref:hypothetical protein n=1 Tax=uncultured Amnibacterium sp. TaxID=1631851 RepID=UPI0035CA116A